MLSHKYTFFAILCTLLIFLVSSLPDRSFAGNGLLNDQVAINLAHIPAYALLTFLWIKSFVRRENPKRFVTVWVFIGLMLFAISDEFHQSFVPGRSACLKDIGFDFLGIMLGFALSKIIWPVTGHHVK